MKHVEFEEEQDLIQTPEPVHFAKPSPFAKKFTKFKISKSDLQGIVLLVVLAMLLFAASGVILFKANKSGIHSGIITPPESLTEIEKYKLPESIRAYIK